MREYANRNRPLLLFRALFVGFVVLTVQPAVYGAETRRPSLAADSISDLGAANGTDNQTANPARVPTESPGSTSGRSGSNQVVVSDQALAWVATSISILGALLTLLAMCQGRGLKPGVDRALIGIGALGVQVEQRQRQVLTAIAFLIREQNNHVWW